ncbi:MAG TPA: MarR family transcriptional regulator [Mycobacteriales bacterium]|jgi:DNA-binding MarR family transcriptional regulator|nr:MarR family transcriptional regulator [Mycobacteriales bacterium]
MDTETDTALAEQLYATVGLLRRHARKIGERPFPNDGPTTAQLELIRLVRRTPGLSVADAAAELGVAPNTVSTLVRQLTGSGVLERHRDAADGRVARLQLTPETRRRVEQWRDRRTAVTARAIAGLSPADRAALERALPVLAGVATDLTREEVTA